MQPSSGKSGFTLIETAIVMVIVALMLGGLMMSLSKTTENTRRSDVQAQLAEISEALYGFAQAKGRLPCPAIPASNGAEHFYPAELPKGGGVCTRPHGFVPSATLGLKGPVNADGLLLDPWNNPLRYSVTTANTSAFTKVDVDSPPPTVDGMRRTKMANLAPDLRICREAACTNVISSTAPAVILSMGKNWPAFTSADEIANGGEATIGGGPSGMVYRIANNNDFVSASYNETTFDDIITWISPNILYTKMISAGQLP
jgi:prepilin-type N-terminal cleavage/methylation domain-containing protein